MKRMSRVLGIGMLAACLAITGCKKKPAADFTADATSGTAPLTVQFTDTSTPGGSPITAWLWLFGDGAKSTAQNPSHVYTMAGTYNVSLEVTASAGSDTELKLNHVTVSFQSETVMLPGNVPLEMVRIPGGSFLMGSPDTEQDRQASEGPQHSVTLDEFWVGRYQLTKRQWQAVMGTTPWTGQLTVLTDPDSTAVYISWNDAQSFITSVNIDTGQTFRLPSEAEWEYACRAGTTTRFYWGDDLGYTAIGSHAWYRGNIQSDNYAHVVGQKPPNTWGLYDMSGNVWEWCQDWMHDSYAGAPSDGSAWETPVGMYRVARGGGWYGDGYTCRSAYRGNGGPDTESSAVGFRLAR